MLKAFYCVGLLRRSMHQAPRGLSQLAALNTVRPALAVDQPGSGGVSALALGLLKVVRVAFLDWLPGTGPVYALLVDMNRSGQLFTQLPFANTFSRLTFRLGKKCWQGCWQPFLGA